MFLASYRTYNNQFPNSAAEAKTKFNPGPDDIESVLESVSRELGNSNIQTHWIQALKADSTLQWSPEKKQKRRIGECIFRRTVSIASSPHRGCASEAYI